MFKLQNFIVPPAPTEFNLKIKNSLGKLVHNIKVTNINQIFSYNNNVIIKCQDSTLPIYLTFSSSEEAALSLQKLHEAFNLIKANLHKASTSGASAVDFLRKDLNDLRYEFNASTSGLIEYVNTMVGNVSVEGITDYIDQSIYELSTSGISYNDTVLRSDLFSALYESTSGLSNIIDEISKKININVSNIDNLRGDFTQSTSGLSTIIESIDNKANNNTSNINILRNDFISSTSGLVNFNNKIGINAQTPINPTDVANKRYVDSKSVDIAKTQYSNFFGAENGMYFPILTAEGLENMSGLTNHVNGGVVSAFAGTAGEGSLYLPKPIDMSKPWRSAVLIEINDSDPVTEIHFCDNSANFYSGLRITKISTTGINGTIAGVTAYNGYGASTGIPVGTKIWIGLAYDGSTYVTNFLIPDDNPNIYGFGSTPGFNAPWSNWTVANKQDKETTNAGRSVYGGSPSTFLSSLCRLRIRTQSSQNRIIGVWWSEGLGGPQDGLLTPPAIINMKVLNDETGWVVIPKTLSNATTDAICLMHPNGNVGSYGINNNGNPAELAKIINSGYLMFGLTGVDNASDYAGATSSNWGAAAGTRYRKAQFDWVKNNIPGLRNWFLLGQSMGVMDCLRFAAQHPNLVDGIIGISGAVDLLDSFTNRGFNSIIQKAYGTWYLCNIPITGLDPTLLVTISATAASGATTLFCSALTSQLPAGTILTFQSGTGQQNIVTSALANANATSIQINASTSGISNGTRYNVNAHWTQISVGYGQPSNDYYTDSYIWRDSYSQSTSYDTNNVIVKASSNTVNYFRFADPCSTPYVFKKIPIILFHGDSDALIPISQAITFRNNVNAIEGNVTLITIAGGTHLSTNCYDANQIITFMQNNS